MREVIIQIPTLDAEQNIEIDVRINGHKRTLKYRVEIVDCEATICPTSESKVEELRRVINKHDKDWDLIQIGAPTSDHIPIMFRRKLAKVPE